MGRVQPQARHQRTNNLTLIRSLLKDTRITTPEGLRARVIEVKAVKGEAQICVLKGRPR